MFKIHMYIFLKKLRSFLPSIQHCKYNENVSLDEHLAIKFQCTREKSWPYFKNFHKCVKICTYVHCANMVVRNFKNKARNLGPVYILMYLPIHEFKKSCSDAFCSTFWLKLFHTHWRMLAVFDISESICSNGPKTDEFAMNCETENRF
jgi:hypothetical protein